MQFEAFMMLLLIGAAAGHLASLILRGYGIGTIGNIFIGIAGALIVGWMVPPLGFVPGIAFADQMISATIGAVLLLILIQFVRKAA